MNCLQWRRWQCASLAWNHARLPRIGHARKVHARHAGGPQLPSTSVLSSEWQDATHLSQNDYLRLILTARVYDVAVETPLQHARTLSGRLGTNIYLKREDLQPVFSFKLRGAYNKMVNLSEDELRRGFTHNLFIPYSFLALTCNLTADKFACRLSLYPRVYLHLRRTLTKSHAGNHAQGVALAAQRMGVRATILMPVFTPIIKVRAVRRLGAEVILFGSDFDAAALECRRLSAEDGRVIIHPYDDPHVIAGQGTIALELLRQWPSLSNPSQMKTLNGGSNNNNGLPKTSQSVPSLPSAIFVCVGGGGLISGVAVCIKALYPSIRIIGVEAIDADAMTQSLKKGERVELKEVGLFADGAAVRLVGKETFRLAKHYVDDMILVNNDEICAGIKDAFEDTRSILEPAGALALAGCKKYTSLHPTTASNESYICITSGANMNFNRLRFVAERAELGENREALLAVTIPEKPGAFMQLYSLLYPRNVTEFSYRYADSKQAHIYLSFEVRDHTEVDDVVESLSGNGLLATDISGNDMAKDHTRYLAGGRSIAVQNERIFRFTFPERPGALLRFLQCLAGENPTVPSSFSPSLTPSTTTSNGQRLFNVSLFHYRNYAADTGKVLAGIQVPPEKTQEFQLFLDSLGYPYTEETSNPVYKQFLL